jgi:hypothetical protein
VILLDEKQKELERWLDNYHLRRDVKQIRMESNPRLFGNLEDFLLWLDLGVDLDDNMLNELLRIFEEADFVDQSRSSGSVHHLSLPPAE